MARSPDAELPSMSPNVGLPSFKVRLPSIKTGLPSCKAGVSSLGNELPAWMPICRAWMSNCRAAKTIELGKDLKEFGGVDGESKQPEKVLRELLELSAEFVGELGEEIVKKRLSTQHGKRKLDETSSTSPSSNNEVKKGAKAGLGITLRMNKTSEDVVAGYVQGVHTLSQYADYLVINVSSPNTSGFGMLQGKKATKESWMKEAKRKGCHFGYGKRKYLQYFSLEKTSSLIMKGISKDEDEGKKNLVTKNKSAKVKPKNPTFNEKNKFEGLI
ncbi:hypothetical protein LR48_Vigan01g116900 [Vigna angularis]|uniref:Dihydroorotate dehydrogenase catalytic domain-containing protein n=1 Tax=Phaseolus angularis TaxID=3914 RepID=A0A0L9TN73_PHAAN|nr:hypothetical protein LR48_Vigan01g116900 [Vigna angularis]